MMTSATRKMFAHQITTMGSVQVEFMDFTHSMISTSWLEIPVKVLQSLSWLIFE